MDRKFVRSKKRNFIIKKKKKWAKPKTKIWNRNFSIFENLSLIAVPLIFILVFQCLYYRHCNYKMPTAGYSGEGNEKNFDEKLFTTDPFGALFTESRGGTFWNFLHLIGWDLSVHLACCKLMQRYRIWSCFDVEKELLWMDIGINKSWDLVISASTG